MKAEKVKSPSKSVAVYEMRRENGFRWFFELYVHKTAKGMVLFLEKRQTCGKPVTKDTRGMVIPCVVIDVTTGKIKPLFAEMHLNEEWTSAGVIAHECLHVAMAHERATMFSMNYGDEIGNDEERLAYLLTDITKSVYDVLYANKHINRKILK